MSGEEFVRLAGVGVTYGSGSDQTQALCPTDLSIAKGDFVALVGPSGCGKSTILKLISELLKPSEGNILVSFLTIPQSTASYSSTRRENACPLIVVTDCEHTFANIWYNGPTTK